MPVNPNTVDKNALGKKGRDLNRTVSENALDFDINTLGAGAVNAHINDPIDAHAASAISILDTADYYNTVTAEGVTAELGNTSDLSNGDGVLVGGTITTLLLTVTLAAGTQVRIAGNSRDYSSLTVALTPNTLNYAYIDKATRTLVASLAPPNISAGVLLWVLQTDATSVTLARDARYFVTNSDRKDIYTVSEGTTENDRSEGNFRSVDAAILYINIHAVLGYTKALRLLIRGDVTVPSAIIMPGGLNGISIEGDGRGALLRTGATLSPMFNVNGHDRLTFRNIDFVCDHAGSTVVAAGVGDAGNDLVMEHCRVLSGVTDWVGGVAVVDTAIVSGTVIKNCSFATTGNAIRLDVPTDCELSDTVVTAVGFSSTFTAISLGVSGGLIPITGGNNNIRGCNIQGYDGGMYLSTTSTVVEGNAILLASIGIELDGGIANVITGNSIECGIPNGLKGITNTGSSDCRITDNWIKNDKAFAGAETPRGIELLAGSNGAILSGNIIRGFRNDALPEGAGISVGIGVNDVRIHNCTIETAFVGVLTLAGENLRVTDCTISKVAIGISSDQDFATIANTNIILEASNTAYGAKDGIQITGLVNKVSSCNIQNPRVAYVAPTDTTNGIQVFIPADDVTISNTHIEGFLNPGTVEGKGIFLRSNRSTVTGGRITLCTTGVWVAGAENTILSEVRVDTCVDQGIFADVASHHLKIRGCEITGPGADYGIWVVSSEDTLIEGNTIECDFLTGTGIRLEGALAGRTRRFSIVGNSIREAVGYGIRLEDACQQGVVANNIIDGYQGAAVPTTSVGINLTSTVTSPTEITISGNRIERCYHGITALGTASVISSLKILGNSISYIAHADSDTALEDFDSMGAHGIGLLNVAGTVITNNEVQNIGQSRNDDGTVFSPAANVSANGIFLQNCSGMTVDNNKIFLILATGTANAHGVHFIFWNTGLNTTYRNFQVNGNNFATIQGGALRVVTAKGTVTPSLVTTLQQFTANSNTVNVTLANSVDDAHAFYFDVGVDDELTQVKIGNNSLRQIHYAGIYLHANAPSTTLTNISITGNTIFDFNNSNTGANGIWLAMTDNTSLAFGNIQIANNTVDSDSINEILIFVVANIDYGNVTVEGNHLYNGDTGIHIAALEAGGTVSSVVVNDNLLEGYDNGGIIVQGVGSVRVVNIDGNNCTSDNAASGIFVVASSTTLPSLEISITNNVTFGPLDPLKVSMGYVLDVTIADNTIRGNPANPSFANTNGILFSANAALNPQMENIKIQGNRIKNTPRYGIQVLAQGTGTAINVEISRNSLDTVAGSTVAYAAIDLGFEGDVFMFKCDGNIIRNANVAGTANGAINYRVTGASSFFRSSISHNILNSNQGHGIKIGEDGGNSQSVQVLTVDGNMIHTGELKGIYIVDGMGGVEVESLSVCNNKVTSSGDAGIDLNFTSSASLQDLHVNENTIVDAATLGITCNLAEQASSISKNISFHGNTVDRSVGGTTTIGLNIQASNQLNTFDLQNISICNNTCNNTTTNGIVFVFSPNSTVSTLKGLTVDGNLVRECGTLGVVGTTLSNDSGARFLLRGDTENFILSNNQFLDNARVGFLLHTGETNSPIVGANAGIGTSLLVSGNIARGNELKDVGRGGTSSFGQGIIADNIQFAITPGTMNTSYGAGVADTDIGGWVILNPLFVGINNNQNV